MRICFENSTIFGRMLKPSEKADYFSTLENGKKALGNTGTSMLILPSYSIPQKSQSNSGVGRLLSEEGLEFIDFVKQYWGINTIQLLPEGEMHEQFHRYCPYLSSSFSLGIHNIDTEQLTTNEGGKLISMNDIDEVIKANKIDNKETKINFANVIDENSSMDKILRKAYDNLIMADTSEKQTILNELKDFEKINKSWLEPKAIFILLSNENKTKDYRKWDLKDYSLYDETQTPLTERKARITELRTKYNTEIGFYNFKQYLAEKHFIEAKRKINNKGISLNGDMLLAFSQDEVWANPNAFKKNTHTKWGIPALDFESETSKDLLRKKVNKFAKLYDGIRVDAAWAYCVQPIYDNNTGKLIERIDYKDEILNLIDDEFKKSKGKNYKPEYIMYEMVADAEDYNAFEGEKLKSYLDNRIKIYCSDFLNFNWATTDAFRRKGWKDGTYIIGTTNHDTLPMKFDYEKNVEKRKWQSKVLGNILKIPSEKIELLNEFIKAKFAEPLNSKHNMLFFHDALNLDGIYNIHNNLSEDSFKQKIPETYMTDYFKSLEKDEGYNAMDALEKSFVAQGLDKTNPDLYKKIVKYRNILQSKTEKRNSLPIISAIGVLAVSIIVYFVIHHNKTQKKTNNNQS